MWVVMPSTVSAWQSQRLQAMSPDRSVVEVGRSRNVDDVVNCALSLLLLLML